MSHRAITSTAAVAALLTTAVHAFVPPTPSSTQLAPRVKYASTTPASPLLTISPPLGSLLPLSATKDDGKDEIDSMRASELRKELQSYGISTKSFFEKSELVEAVRRARAEGKKPIDDGGGDSSGGAAKDKGAPTSSGAAAAGGKSRDELIRDEMEKLKSRKVGELKKELEDLGISTKSFFEKSEFVRALAEARVDGVKAKSGAGGGASSAGASGGGRSGAGFGWGGKRKAGAGGQQKREAEPYDPSYRDVTCTKFDRRMLTPGGVLIDIRLG